MRCSSTYSFHDRFVDIHIIDCEISNISLILLLLFTITSILTHSFRSQLYISIGLVIYITGSIFYILYFSISGLYKRIINRHIYLYIEQIIPGYITFCYNVTYYIIVIDRFVF